MEDNPYRAPIDSGEPNAAEPEDWPAKQDCRSHGRQSVSVALLSRRFICQRQGSASSPATLGYYLASSVILRTREHPNTVAFDGPTFAFSTAIGLLPFEFDLHARRHIAALKPKRRIGRVHRGFDGRGGGRRAARHRNGGEHCER
jgi:hypothetical protein